MLHSFQHSRATQITVSYLQRITIIYHYIFLDRHRLFHFIPTWKFRQLSPNNWNNVEGTLNQKQTNKFLLSTDSCIFYTCILVHNPISKIFSPPLLPIFPIFWRKNYIFKRHKAKSSKSQQKYFEIQCICPWHMLTWLTFILNYLIYYIISITFSYHV